MLQSLRNVPVRSFSANIIVPQSRAFVVDRAQHKIEIAGVNVGVVIVEQVAMTTMDIQLKNPGGSRLESRVTGARSAGRAAGPAT